MRTLFYTLMIIVLMSCASAPDVEDLNSFEKFVYNAGSSAIIMGLQCENAEAVRADVLALILKVSGEKSLSPKSQICETAVRFVLPVIKSQSNVVLWNCAVDPFKLGEDVLIAQLCSRI